MHSVKRIASPAVALEENSISGDEILHRLQRHDSSWLSTTLQKRWKHLMHDDGRQDFANILDKQTPVSPFDMTSPELPEGLKVSEYVLSIRSYDWSSTKLGQMSTWSAYMRRLANLCLNDKRPCATFFGPQRLVFYNEGYANLAGRRHPAGLGQPFEVMWGTQGHAESFLKAFETMSISGQSAAGDDMCFITERHGFREELHVSWSINPLFDATGTVSAYYTTIVDNTQRELSARRLTTLLSLSQATSTARSVDQFWNQTLQGCEPNDCDIPFAILYSLAAKCEDKPNRTSHVTPPLPHPRPDRQDPRTWKLEGSVGLGPDFHGLPEEICPLAAAKLLTPAFPSALTSGQLIILTTEDGTFPELLQGVARSRTHGDLCQKAIMFSMSPANRDGMLGFMIIGINPMSEYDSAYQQFIQHLVRQCADSLASVLILEEATHMTQLAIQAAAQDHVNLSAKLADKQQEIYDRETRFRAMADLAPVGMFHIDGAGTVLYANKRWLQLTQHAREKWAPMSWMAAVYPDDVKLVEHSWETLLRGEGVSFEMRLNTLWTAPDGDEEPGPTWTIASAYAETGPDGSVTACLGCVTDISHQKWMERIQERRTEEALALKQQQENFMDMISHEARNPLAAIMLCAESAVMTMEELIETSSDPVPIPKHAIGAHLESAETILACAQHQKRIMDDVLTFSKMNAGLLMTCPIPVQPQATIRQALKMIDAEVQQHGITLTLDVCDSFNTVEWAQLDPSRLLQILINLLTNAVKFTKSEEEKRITLTLNATDYRPFASLSGVSYAQDFKHPSTPAAHSDQVYLGFEVCDTGRGLTEDEMEHLFQKFQQASPKTHVEYGGCGLGLFISRQLVRMQGGAIGVSSSGKGAAFAFFIAAQKCKAPRPADPGKDSLRGHLESDPDVSRKSRRSSVDYFSGSVADKFKKPRRHVLVVEDNLINQKVIRTQLERLGYAVSVANHGLEALEHIATTRFCKEQGIQLDVVLLDFEMPVCNGAECARRIRAQERSGQVKGHVPIIGITANARAEQQSVAIEAGMNSVVTKPFRLLELSAELDRISDLFPQQV